MEAKRSTNAARNHTACPCVRARLFRFASLLWGLGYGRIVNYCFRVFPFRFRSVRVVLRFYGFLLLWLSAFPLLAEWETQDRNTLNAIQVAIQTLESESRWNNVTQMTSDVRSIKGYLDNIDTQSNTAKNYLAYVLGNLGYGQGSSQISSISADFNALKANTDNIETLLQSIIDALEGSSGGSSGGESQTITQDWLKEDTFTTYYDWMRSSFGFEGGSSGSFKDLIFNFFDSFRVPKVYKQTEFWYTGGDTSTPFPGSNLIWPEYWNSYTYSSSYDNPWEYIVLSLSNMSWNNNKILFDVAKKQSWNDWQAHTNLVATITQQADRFFTPPANDPSPTPSFDASTGSIITPSGGTGSADSSLSIQPSLTNDFAVIEQDINTTTNSFNFVSRSDIEDRYFSDDYLSVGSYHDYSSMGGGFSDSINLGGIVINLQDNFVHYRKIITTDTLQTVRSAFGYVWYFLAAIAAFFTVTKVAGISVSEASE